MINLLTRILGDKKEWKAMAARAAARSPDTRPADTSSQRRPAMINLLTRILGDKKEWKAMEARADALPRDYQAVYDEMKGYMWRFASGDGMAIIAVLKDVLGLFETSAAERKGVLDVTGEDVAAFCDERLRGTTSYFDTWRASLNREVARKLAD